MKTVGIIILGIIILVIIAVLTLVFEILQFFVGAILFVVALIVLGYFYFKIKKKLD